LKVGPRSAGASPGPVCYGKGNEEPTVTDANVVLQVLNPTHLLGGRMPIDQARARAAIARLAERLGLDVMRTAQGIISVVTANMAKAIRVISVERGYDPRDYVLMAFGGAGPVHAARLARELEIPRLLVPRNPGILCAMGLLLTDLRIHLAAGRMAPLAETGLPALAEGFADLHAQADDWFAREGIAEGDRMTERAIDLRYAGQAHELTIPCPAGAMDAAALATLRARFEEAHRQVYGYISPEEPIRVVALRLEATGRVPKADLPEHPPATTPLAETRIGTREVWLPETGAFTPCPLHDRALLGPGHRIAGPAIIEQMDSTTLVLPGQVATVDPWLNLMIEEAP
jgi:N-methylhydantoinase A